MIQRTSCSFSMKFLNRGKRYTFLVFLATSFLSVKITPTFGSSTFDTLRLGDQITSDVLEELRAFQAILTQPIAIGLLVRGGVGPPGPPGASGDRGEKGTVGDKGSESLEPGTPGYEKIYDSDVKYANEEKTDRRYNGNVEADDQRGVQRKYVSDHASPEKTKIFCEGEESWLGCDHDERINITNAFWGRDDFITCSQNVPSNHSTRQYSLDYDRVLMKVRETCNWRSRCEFFATRLFLNDVTKPQVYKYLRVVYECVPETYDDFGAQRGRMSSRDRVVGLWGRDKSN
ncbi:uncharacterized protein LOC114517373 [Dendronephthya gigantea]|uniref:uncharacterized protein LOC114517373 n=1 Tax=Dendronephthya gigantea TaxID=151771 RepID=UPI00106AB19E|nr:uncharacterized protein LOC114517373 [Dendronephthya gigantea]